MRTSPDVSVIIPTRDRWSLLSRHALPSALGQEGVEVEVIVVDDGSTDGTPERVEALGEPRVRLLRQMPSRGAATAKNAAIRVARGRWIAFLDDDDLWSPEKLARQVGSVGEAGWAYCGGVVVNEHLEIVDVLGVRAAAGIAEDLRRGNAVGGPSSVIVRTELVRAVGGFDESLRGPDDWDLWLRLATRAPAMANHGLLVATLEHPGRWVLRNPRTEMQSVEALLDKIDADKDVRKGVAEWTANERYRGGRRLRASALYARTAIRYRSPGNVPPAVGALFGDAGMALVDRLLARRGRVSHLDRARHVPVDEPAWLTCVRTANR